ncbi:MAG: xanthine dehydrogenase family protein molybdopterin-binding subunit [Hyphomicrobiales bacterium]|nr:xanthine dehydrogenase family protein molybdopterin-binding subunit [Hyphomicrobiales bacterium]
MTAQGIGAAVKRREDFRFIKGDGKYTDDINLPNQTYCYFLRSPVAHAAIRNIDISAAQSAPGVVAVFTGADVDASGAGGVPCGWLVTSRDGNPMKEPKHPILAVGKVRHVGDPVVAVIAETLEQARNASELVQMDLDELPAVVNMKSALQGGSSVHEEAADNLCFDWELGDQAATDAALAGAAHVTKLDLVNNRLIPNAMEPRVAIGQYAPGTEDYTLYTTSQNPHVIRLLMGAFVLSIPEHKLRVYAPDVGGGFGSKIYHYAEEALVTWASKHIRRPVKWTSDRSEAFMSDAHGRDHLSHVEMAFDADNRIIALKCETLANMGAYLSTFAPCIPTWLHGTLLAGQYVTPAIYTNVKAVFTNTVPVDAYRGAGRPEATYILERTISKAAQELGVDQAELRRKNFIQPNQFPYQTPVAVVYDTGDYEPALNKAMELADYAAFEQRRAEAKSRGKLRGIGVASYIEACGIAPSSLVGALGARAGLYEAATVRVNPTGSVSVLTGSHSHGQGHETTFAQVVADKLGIDIGNVDIVHGDTDKIPFGMGTYGSRSIAVGGSALVNALDKVIEKGKKIAAHLLEASADDIEFANGAYTVKGTDKSKAFGDIALTAYVPHQYPIETLEPGLEETAFYDPKNFTYPAGTYICEVEIDPQTGSTQIVSFSAADDFGNVINPMIVEGQVHGGVVQGVGQALMENAVYDDNGQLLTGSYMDYTMPRADDVPSFKVATLAGTPCTHNPLGVKGCGEAGAIGAPPAVINAIVDALKEYGIDHIDMPATPEKIWRAINAQPRMAAE